MESFAQIYARAVARKGSVAALEALLPGKLSNSELAALDDNDCLAAMARCVFRAGFSWRVIDNKWSGFEAAFEGFDVDLISLWPEEELDRLSRDTRIVRNYQKILATRDNAVYVLETAAEHGSFGRFLAEWPLENTVELWAHMKKHGSRLGGMSGPMVLRLLGRDTFLPTQDVLVVLKANRVLDHAKATSKRDLAAMQAAFNTWQAESGRPFCEISRIAACSVGDDFL